MLNSISSLRNVKTLDKAAQKQISGGFYDDGSGPRNEIICFAQDGNGGVNAYVNDSFSAALAAAKAGAVGHYCCSSCPSATWLVGVVTFYS